MWSSVICGFWSLVLKLCRVFNQANYAKLSEGHKRFRRSLLMLKCRPNTHSTLFWLEMKSCFLQANTVFEIPVWNTSIYTLHTLRLLCTPLQKSNYPLLRSNVDMETSLLFPSPCPLKTLHYTYNIYLFLAASQKKKYNPLSKFPSLWIGLCCNPFWIYPRPACLLG